MKINLCLHCAKKFKARAGKKYCSDKCRYEAWRVTAHPCYYCGCPANTVDHVPPQSARPILMQHQVSKWPFIEVNACLECNSALGAKAIWTLPERKAHIKKWLARRYSRVLKTPKWTPEEIDELGRGLHQFVKESQFLAELTRNRINW